MNANVALGRLHALGVVAITTDEASAVLGLSVSAANKTLTRLASAGHATRIARGLWWIAAAPIDQLRLLDHVAAPFAAYVSMQSALSLHGMIEQIPSVVFAVTLGRTCRVNTSVGTFSLHHVAPEMYGGYVTRDDGVKIATPEKALIDMAWLSSNKTRLFTNVPELTLPKKFNARALEHWTKRMQSPRARTLARERFERFVQHAINADE